MKWDLDSHKQITELDLQSPILAEKKPINRFVVGSTLLHILSASAILVLGQFPQPKPEIVEIELTSAPIAPIASAPIPAPVEQVAAPAPIAEKVVTPEPAPVVAAKPAPAAPKTVAPIAKATPTPAAPAPKLIPVAQTVDAQAEPEPEPTPAKPEPIATIDDIETPTLDDSEVAAIVGKKPDHPKVSKKEIEDKLAQAEKAQAEKAALLAQKMQEDANATDSDINDKMNEAASAVEAQNAASAAEAEERTQAIRDAQAAQAVQAEAKEAAEGQDARSAETQNAGAGKAGELRALDQLRQMPGNPKPQYEAQERLKGHNGNVIFKAFVTNDGRLTDFALLQSTGHRNLDLKTLKALKQWKFYPGQQGWVELPFKWDLKGGPQEMPTLLRRRVGQN